MTTTAPPAPLRGLVVAGTDTGVGKTLVSAGLLRLAARRGVRLVPFKPSESGCPSLRRPADALFLLTAASRSDLSASDVCLYPFRPPVAPAAAARAAGQTIRLPRLLAAARRLATQGEGLLVEGAGGVLSPYGPRLTILDLAAALDLPLLLVARNSLGTINHTALAVAEIRRRRLPLLGYVLVDTSTRTFTVEQNAALIHAQTQLRPLGHLPFLARPTADAAADALAASRSLLRILTRGPGSV